MQTIPSVTIEGVTRSRVAYRNEEQLLVEVTTDLVGGFSLCEQYIDAPYPKRNAPRVPHKQVIHCYASELAGVQAKVRTDAHLAAWETAKYMASAELSAERTSIESELAQAKPGSGAEKRAESKLADLENRVAGLACVKLGTLPGLKDGLPPLLSARVIHKAPPPSTPESRMEALTAGSNANLAAVLARLLDERDSKRKG